MMRDVFNQMMKYRTEIAKIEERKKKRREERMTHSQYLSCSTQHKTNINI